VKRLIGRRFLFVVPLVLVLALLAASSLGVVRLPVVLKVAIGGQPAEAAPQKGHKTPERGIPVSLGERVVNLADPGGFRYLKAEIVVELAVDGIDPERLSVEKLKHEKELLAKEIEPWQPQIQDVLTMVLTSKTVADVSTPEGKEALKQELADRLQPLFHHHEIKAVYLAQFVIQ
jgi:flagellar FliL protein